MEMNGPVYKMSVIGLHLEIHRSDCSRFESSVQEQNGRMEWARLREK